LKRFKTDLPCVDIVDIKNEEDLRGIIKGQKEIELWMENKSPMVDDRNEIVMVLTNLRLGENE
jgi:hypothetical protein